MLYHQIVAVVLAAVLLNLLLNLRALRRAKCDDDLPDPAPRVSVLIPARNEESNIDGCLESLRKQDYPNYELIVLDDSSCDATGRIVEQHAARDERVRLVRGQPLPPGWAGKPFACHQLAQEAKGSWLLFTDADTTYAPNAVRCVLNTALDSGASLISGFPYQRTSSIWQKMAMPIMCYFMLLCWVPLWWLQRSRGTLPSIAIGQFLFFSADAYRSIGGHETVKSRLLEDVWLGREMARHKYRQLTLDLSQLVSCQMYREFDTMWNGIARWLYSVASVSVLVLVVLLVVALLLFLAPFLWLLHGLLFAQPALGLQVLVVLQVAILLLARFLAGRRFAQPAASTVLHPLGIGFLLLVGVWALSRYVRGGGVTWKERVYGPESQVS